MKTMRRVTVLLLFAALVTALLWFQGILFRHEPETTRVPEAPRLASGVRTARVERRALGEERTFPGFVEPVDPAPVAARVMATVLELDVREGDAVQVGQTLARLDDRDAATRLSQAEAARAAAAARALAARLAFERAGRLLEAEALTQADWEAARAAHDGARADEEGSAAAVEEARAALSWFRVEAPFDGMVLERLAEPGQLAAPGRALVTLYRRDRLRLAVPVPEEYAARFRLDQRLDVELDGGPDRAATLARVLPASDRESGTVTLHLVPDDPDDLRPGQLVRLRFAVAEREALVIPAGAVERIGQVERVALVRDGRVVTQTVRTGKAHGESVEILSGLAAGEEVVWP